MSPVEMSIDFSIELTESVVSTLFDHRRQVSISPNNYEQQKLYNSAFLLEFRLFTFLVQEN
jgi:hypothetical protein